MAPLDVVYDFPLLGGGTAEALKGLKMFRQPAPPVPHGVARAEEGFSGSGENGYDQLVCVIQPEYEFVAAPNGTQTDDKAAEDGNLGEATCAIAKALDPFQPNPAFTGTGAGLGRLLDEVTAGMESIPPSTFPVFELAREAVAVLGFARDVVSSGYSFVCEQIGQEGQYHELLPVDEITRKAEKWWGGLTPAQKIASGVITVALMSTAAILLVPK
jgi:hypothetical protein